jgi:hypothetical protein
MLDNIKNMSIIYSVDGKYFQRQRRNKMKFYYNNKLMRTSKTHEYKYAVVKVKENGELVCYGCSATRKGAEAKITELTEWSRRNIASCENALKALRSGRTYYDWVDGRRTSRTKLEEGDTEESLNERIEGSKANIKRIHETCKIVELEARP